MASANALIKLSDPLREAVLTLARYVARASGTEPSQKELSAALNSYFTLDEVTNQLNYLRRKPHKPEEGEAEPEGDSQPGAPWRFNLARPPSRNSILKAGWVVSEVAKGIEAIRKHAAGVMGSVPSDREIADSLCSSFILSELKNQIVHARNQSRAELDLE